MKLFQLWEYAASYWARHLDHLSQTDTAAHTTNRILQIFKPGAQALLNMVQIGDLYNSIFSHFSLPVYKLALLLYYTASMGQLQFVELLIKNGHNVQEVSNKGRYDNALQAAAFRGHENIVQLLLDRGADVNAQGGEYGAVLQAVAYHGNKYIVQLLLDRGVDVNAKGGGYGTALQVAAFEGHESIVQFSFDRGADVNAKGGGFGSALQAAIARDKPKLRRYFSRRGAEWEMLLATIKARREGELRVGRLRKLQENPAGYIANLREQKKREEEGCRSLFNY